MAYGYPYPIGYNPYQQNMNLYPTGYNQQNQQIQNGGFVRVKGEQEVLDYPLAPGYTMTFITEDATHCYTKTAGFNQFDKPKIDKYRLVKESVAETPVATGTSPDSPNLTDYVLKAEFAPVLADLEGIKKDLAALTKPKRTKEAKEDADQ